MKTFLLSSQSTSSVGFYGKTMKNDPFLSSPMDLPEEKWSQQNGVNDEKVFIESSGYKEDNDEDAKTKDNVNTTTSQWPLRHNNETSDKLSYSYNGFRRRKSPHCTYTGRISRIPSRYLSSDSDSSDGSPRRDVRGPAMIKVKRRRKSSNIKLLVNGFTEHCDKMPVVLTDIRKERVILDVNEEGGEHLANSDCSEVFEETSPISDDTVSGMATEGQARKLSAINNTLGEALKGRQTFVEGNPGDILHSKSNSLSELSLKKTPVCCFKATGGCVDISCENKRGPRFNSSLVSSQQTFKEIACDNEKHGEFEREICTERNSATDVSVYTCTKEDFKDNEGSCDSSTRRTLVSSADNLKQSKVSCTCPAGNDPCVAFQKGNDCRTCIETSPLLSVDSSFCSNIADGEELDNHLARKLDFVNEDVVLLDSCREVKDTLPVKQFAVEDKARRQMEETDCQFKSAGLNCFRNFKIKRAYTNKLNQKHIRRNVKTSGKPVARKNRLINTLTQKSFDKVEKTAKLERKIHIKKASNKKEVQSAKPARKSRPAQDLDTVLGMRRNQKGVYEFLVQWTNGTSCWVSSDQIVTNKHNSVLREYFVDPEQDVSVINRIPFQAYCCHSLSLKECKPVIKVAKKEKERVVAKGSSADCKTPGEKQEVTVEHDGDGCYITLKRETCKRKLTCMRIIADLIAALEDASVGDCQMVIIRGLGSKVFGGLTLESVCTASAEEIGNMILLKARYLVQTMSNYPKPLIALISRSAEGIGAVFLSLFDMICDEETWKKKEVIATSEKACVDDNLFSLPRVKGHSIPCEEILMGKKCERVQLSLTPSPVISETVASKGASVVGNTLKEIEMAMHCSGKRPLLFGVNGEDISKMNRVSDCPFTHGGGSSQPSCEEPEDVSCSIPKQLTFTQQHLFTHDTRAYNSTGSAPVDRYVRELESEILKEKEFVQQYFHEVSNVWSDLSNVCNVESYICQI